MEKRFPDDICVLCHHRYSTTKGEHAWPLWLYRAISQGGSPPYDLLINGNSINVADKQKSHSITTPACEQCNRVLSARFENSPFMPAVKSFARRQSPLLVASSFRDDFARWLIKCLLFTAHPKAWISADDARTQFADFRWARAEPSLMEWMIDGKDPPSSLSLWIARREAEHRSASDAKHVALPTIVYDDEIVEFKSVEAGFVGLSASLVYHPKWPIDHPLEAAGKAIRLWPAATSTSTAIAPGDFPATRTGEFAWLQGPRIRLRRGLTDLGNLPPLSCGYDFSFRNLYPIASHVSW